MEFSKKIVIATGVIFSFVVVICLGIFVYCTVSGTVYDWSGIVTLLSVSGAVFGTSSACYYNKSRHDNVYKLRKLMLREKYTILQEIGALDVERARTEIESEIERIDSGLDTAETDEVTYQTFG